MPTLTRLALWLASTIALVSADCQSYGVDFQGGGTYFQNVTSTSPFTFVSTFAGCESDVATNTLIDPDGNEYSCTDTPLQPDNTPELSTCSINKNQLYSGEWSVVLLSNNGNGDQIAFERDFSILAGTPTTVTVTPTVPVIITEVPTSQTTVTSMGTSYSTVETTITVPSKTKTPSTTIHPQTTTTITKTSTSTTTTRIVSPIYVTKTKTATCVIPSRQPHADPWARITPTRVHFPARRTAAARLLGRVADKVARPMSREREQRIAERKVRLAAMNREKQKRDIDSATVTITDTNSDLWPTSTSTLTAQASIETDTLFTTTTVTTTTTFTDLQGQTTLPTITITGSTTTHTKHVKTKMVITKTVTKSPTVTITTTATPSGKDCPNKGGHWSCS